MPFAAIPGAPAPHTGIPVRSRSAEAVLSPLLVKKARSFPCLFDFDERKRGVR